MSGYKNNFSITEQPRADGINTSLMQLTRTTKQKAKMEKNAC
jgi:hypothetical protein